MAGVAALALVAGCSAFNPPGSEAPEIADDSVYLSAVPAKQRTVMSKSYQTGERYSVGVGQPMIGVKNYTVSERVARAISLQDFEQPCPGSFGADTKPCSGEPLGLLHGSLGQSFNVAGSITENGFIYYLVEFPTDGGTAYLLADADGYLRPQDYVAWREKDESRLSRRGLPLDLVETKVRLEPSGALFGYETDETMVAGGADYLNYELLYNGIGYDQRGPNFNLIYREYRRDGGQVPAYEQNLVFQASQAIFDMLGMRIQVHEVSDDAVSFTVLEDSLPAG